MSVWFWVIIGVAAALLVLSVVASASLFFGMFTRSKLPQTFPYLSKNKKKMFLDDVQSGRKWLENTKREEVSIRSEDGLKLKGIFINQNSNKTVILVHGYMASHLFRVQDAPFYYNLGFNILLVDQRTHGMSEGKYITCGILESKDLIRWVEFINLKLKSEIILDGVSMGAATVICASADENLPENVKFAVADCSYTTMRELTKTIFKRYALVPNWVIIGIGEGFARRVGKFSFHKGGPLECVKKAKIPILFLHGDKDTFIPHKMADELYANCASPSKLIKIKGAGHAMCFCEDRITCQNAVEDMIERYMQDK